MTRSSPAMSATIVWRRAAFGADYFGRPTSATSGCRPRNIVASPGLSDQTVGAACPWFAWNAGMRQNFAPPLGTKHGLQVAEVVAALKFAQRSSVDRPGISEQRSAMAKQLGLGRKRGRSGQNPPSPGLIRHPRRRSRVSPAAVRERAVAARPAANPGPGIRARRSPSHRLDQFNPRAGPHSTDLAVIAPYGWRSMSAPVDRHGSALAPVRLT